MHVINQITKPCPEEVIREGDLEMEYGKHTLEKNLITI